jgi:hypothetical protein
MKIIIAGISETYYVGEKYDDSETNIDPKPAIRVAHVIYGFINDEKIAIHLDADDSIYHTSYLWYDFSIRQNAYIKAELVPNFKPFSYVPKYNVMEIDMPITIKDGNVEISATSIENDAFTFHDDEISENDGHYEINYDMFVKTSYWLDGRVVWILENDAHQFADKLTTSPYNTDSTETLPDVIYDNVILIGPIYKHSVNDIVPRLFACPKVVVCNMKPRAVNTSL